jgi:phosphoglycolate phosphatase
MNTDKRAVLFDLDGTLLDTLEDIAEAANRVLMKAGLPTHPVAAYRRFVGGGVRTLLERATAEAACPEEGWLDQSVQAFAAIYHETWNRKTRPFPGVMELLERLRGDGVPLAVLSNKPDEFTRLCVDEYFGADTFQQVRGERVGTARKPDPGAALEIAEALGVAPSDSLFVGDSDVDMHTAVAAKMMPVGVLWGFRSAEELREAGARMLLEHPRELLRHVSFVDGSFGGEESERKKR